MLALLFVQIDLYFDFLVLEMDKKTAADVRCGLLFIV